MKGIVFTEFLDFVSSHFSDDMADSIVETCNLPSGGAYTSVGTYDHREMARLLAALSAEVHEPVETLLKQFGLSLIKHFATAYPDFFNRADGLFDFVASVEDHIHVEVCKLYPDAELPTFDIVSQSPDRMVFHYQSCRSMACLASGLIEGASDYFSTPIMLEQEALTDKAFAPVKFTLTRTAA